MVQMNSSVVKERAVDQVYEEALDRFRYLFNEAQKTGLREPAAMTLATASREGRASVRTMVVRKFDNRGFAFFTNSHNRIKMLFKDGIRDVPQRSEKTVGNRFWIYAWMYFSISSSRMRRRLARLPSGGKPRS